MITTVTMGVSILVQDVLVVVFLTSVLTTTVLGVTDPVMLGCYADIATDVDLSGTETPVEATDFDFEQCRDTCQVGGYPYLGLQAKSKCICGHTFGKHGTSINCNYTCGDDKINCGGVGANDIFYTIKVDSTSESLRNDEIYTEGKTFEEARAVCVKYQGDIMPIVTAGQWSAVKQMLSEEGFTSGKIWQGMRKIHDNAPTFSYTDASKPSFGTSSYSNFGAGETFANPCIVIDVSAGTWHTSSCTDSVAYICHQQPPPEMLPTVDDGSGEEEEKNFDMSKLSLYIVLPLFGFCYGGSCLAYCIHKLYRSLKRKKRQKMLLAQMEDENRGGNMREYEPHNKPHMLPPQNMMPYQAKMNMAHMNKMNEAGMMGKMMVPPKTNYQYQPHPKPHVVRPFSAGRHRAIHPILMPTIPAEYATPRQEERTITPVKEIRVSPRGEPEGEMAKEEQETQNPRSARNIDVDIPRTSPPPESSPPPPVVSVSAVAAAANAVDAMKPRSTSAMSKEEARKQKMLNKALKQARDRRRKEAEEAGLSPTPTPSPDENKWAQSQNKSPRYDDDQASGDSTMNLLADSEPRHHSAGADSRNRDPTTMSIQEILRSKVANKRKRPTKPISA